MREFWFRAWDIQRKIMIDGDNFTVDSCGINLADRYLSFDTNCILMQYIGVKDRNERSVCESDIIKQGNALRLIKWDNDITGFAWEWIGSYTVGDAKVTDYEIVGNIYENPELLK